MRTISQHHVDIGYMDTLAGGTSPLHRLDPRAKLLTTIFFIVTVVSFDRYALLPLIPFLLYPLALISMGGLPPGYFLKKVLYVSPFAILVGIFNPLIDQEIVLRIGSLGISGGWISFLSILLRFFLTVTAALVLIALTGFNAVCGALNKLGVPRPFVVQLMFFYRYFFVLADEAQRMDRARTLRSFREGAVPYTTFISLIGHLLLRTLDRAEHVYRAMACRGFDGRVRVLQHHQRGWRETVFVAGWVVIFFILRLHNMPLLLGTWLTGGGT